MTNKDKNNLINKKYCIAGFYHFSEILNLEELQIGIKEITYKLRLLGTILIANEGINGTISGEKNSIDIFFKSLTKFSMFKNIEKKISFDDKPGFKRMKVRLKKEIVKMGKTNISPKDKVGKYVKPENWNELIKDPNTILIDVRNFYESSIGTFKGAIIPRTKSFSEFPEWFDENFNTIKNKKKNIVMFCTGGIRCEKATSYALSEGYKNVFHLKGGILNYLNKTDEKNSLWKGECFVFDDRVSLRHQLKSGSYSMCHACRMPITNEDKESKLYIKGVSCHNCANKKSKEKKMRYSARQKQIDLAKTRGEIHLGKSFK